MYLILLEEGLKEVSFDFIHFMAKKLTYGYLKRYTYAKDYWEDIEQDVSFRVYKVMPKYDPNRGVYLFVWLKVVVYNEIKKSLNKYFFSKTKNETQLIDDDTLCTRSEDMSESCFIKKALDILTDEEKNLVNFVVDGYKYSEICNLMLGRDYLVDPKRPIYRRMLKIKAKIAKELNISGGKTMINRVLNGGVISHDSN